ncbi:MAG: hypothetical protein ACKVU4_04685 [Phycisphaerales bacterium]
MLHCVCVAMGGGGVAFGALAGGPWGNSVVSYEPGSGVGAAFTNPASALGEPTRFTGVGSFPGAVTPFNPPFLGSELVSIGNGGHLVVQFESPVTNDPFNPFGVDLIVFGNTGYIDVGFPNGVAGGLFGSGGGLIELSADGVNWFSVPGAAADSEFPTLGYADLTSPYATSPGLVPTNFTCPVSPALVAAGLNFAQIVAAYDGSGGGTGLDIGLTGLSAVSFVRIIAPAGFTGTIEIDGFADVTAIPAAPTLLAVGLAALAGVGPRRRGDNNRAEEPQTNRLRAREIA